MFESQFQSLQDNIERVIKPYQEECDAGIRKLFSGDSLLDRAVRYSLDAPGKRLRSALHLIMVEALGGDRDKSMAGALCYEMAHTASLVHDDIIDNARLRRGRKPVFQHFGLDAAIVSGDALLIRAFMMMEELRDTDISKEDLLDIIQCTSSMGLKACHGQLMDGKMGGGADVSVKKYIDMITCKTASLIEGPCESAAIFAGRKDLRKQAGLFGRNLGIAFQILDDAKDVYSCESTSLKGRFTDLINNKPNIFIIWAMKKATLEHKGRLHEIMCGKKPHTRDIEFLFRLFETSGVLKSVIRLYGFFLNRADMAASSFPASAGRDKLKEIVRTMLKWPHG